MGSDVPRVRALQIGSCKFIWVVKASLEIPSSIEDFDQIVTRVSIGCTIETLFFRLLLLDIGRGLIGSTLEEEEATSRDIVDRLGQMTSAMDGSLMVCNVVYLRCCCLLQILYC